MSDGFFVVDFSKYQDAYSNLGEDSQPDAEPHPFAEAVNAPLVVEEEDSFIPASWRTSGFEAAVEKEVRRMFIQDAAKVKKREIQHGKLEDPPIFLLDDFLEQDDKPARYVIQDLWPVGGNVLFAAPAKFGKSSVTMNLLRSLMDKDAFLNEFDVEPITAGEGILLIDLEMNEDRVRREIREQGIKNTKSLHVAPLRGLTKQFDFTNEEVRRFWVRYCKENKIRTLIIDPLAPLLGFLAIEENDNTAINILFQQLDDFKKTAGIRDLLITHHCGHTADFRPRGASRFNDWPDAIWLAKLDGNPTDNPPPPRLFFARGRDVGDSFQGPGTLTRGTDKRIGFVHGQAQAPAAAGGGTGFPPSYGIIENLVFTRQGQNTRGLVADATMALSMGDKTVLQLLHDMEGHGKLHSHKVDTDKGKPSYWFTDDIACTYCTGLIQDHRRHRHD